MSTTFPAPSPRDPTPLRPEGPTQPVVVLPRARTPLVGRLDEVAAVFAMLDDGEFSLVTVTGPGGVGKTRLALAVAAQVADASDRDVLFVPLAEIRDASLVMPAIARAAGIPESDESTMGERLAAALRHRAMLMILDNLEQVLEVAPALADLLAACPQVAVLVTSRAPLRISGERVYPLAPLPLPEPGFDSRDVDAVAGTGAVALFLAHARAVDPGFALNPDNVAAVAAICTRLDGLPLAIELAASRIPVLSPQAILARLDRRFALLSAGAVDQPTRLRSLRDAIAWSHDLLDPPVQVLFRRLAVFMGGFTLEDAEAICGDDVVDGITALHRHSLIVRMDRPGNELRYGMLETVREYAIDMLDASDEAGTIRERHARHYAWRVEEARIGYHSPSDPDPTHQRIDVELPNIRLALGWEAAHDRAELLLRLMEVDWWSYLPAEAGRWIERAVAGKSTIPPGRRPLLLATAAESALLQGDVPRARDLLDECLMVAREEIDAKALAIVAQTRARIAERADDLAGFEKYCMEALERWQALDEPSWRVLDALSWLGTAHLRGGNPILAENLVSQALVLAQETGAPWTVPKLRQALAECAGEQGDEPRAARILIESLTAIRDGWPGMIGIRTNPFYLGTVAKCLSQLSAMVGARLDAASAVRLAGAASMLLERSGNRLNAHDRRQVDAVLETARLRLTRSGFDAAWLAGVALSPEAACSEGIAAAGRLAAGAGADRDVPGGLSRREREVLVELAAGHSNRVIAERLSISERTVETHVLHILTKLGLESRTAAVAWAVRHDLA